MDEFIKVIQKLMYDDLSEHQTNQEIVELWEQFLSTKKTTSHVKALHSKLKGVENRFAFETYVKQQRDLVRSGEYGALKFCNNIYKVIQLDYEVHQRWYMQHNAEVNHILQLATNIFKKLPECYHDALLNIMQSALEYILEDSKISKLQKDLNILQYNKLKTTNIDDIMNYAEIKMPAVKHSCANTDIELDILIPQNAVLE
ncbi:26778_t:CDS:2, partial [Dentiscutata erythropus]